MVQLRNRFNGSAAGLHRLLYFLGLDPAPGSKCKTIIWGWLCFMVMSQAGLFVFLVRSAPHLKGFLINLPATLPLFDRSIRLFSVSFIHLILLLKLGGILDSMCRQLNLVDLELHQPNLSKVRKVSIAGVIWTLFVCNSQTIFSMYVESFERKKESFFPFLETIQQFIRIESYMILDVSVVIFSASGQLLVTFYQQLVHHCY
ncbi:hypothetical protein DAPPUDRAFT_315648 [Daphnia pulex]|uniref:Uncharacterized protein n=1 Tax=Daphnia pulex TaxID=6669 RepID=E9GAD2_DAPPU|nr:hypothetical protein DAPPUDRAFT_315648 [Daphnia pulex]|eukprot:EFX83730.1 hypothetical protein DAPPUDRAFT_315648 [Daphnia pulex]